MPNKVQARNAYEQWQKAFAERPSTSYQELLRIFETHEEILEYYHSGLLPSDMMREIRLATSGDFFIEWYLKKIYEKLYT